MGENLKNLPVELCSQYMRRIGLGLWSFWREAYVM
jgi:hypothetical protein